MAVCDLAEYLLHLWQPLLLVDGLHLRVWPYWLTMEAVGYQGACLADVGLSHVVASSGSLEHSFANRYWPLDDFVDHLRIVESQVEHVKVVAPVNGAHVGHT